MIFRRYDNSTPRGRVPERTDAGAVPRSVLVFNEWFAATQPFLTGGREPVAQLVEQRPFKAWVVRSSRTGLTRFPRYHDSRRFQRRPGVSRTLITADRQRDGRFGFPSAQTGTGHNRHREMLLKRKLARLRKTAGRIKLMEK